MVDWVKTGDTRQVLVGENRRCCCLAFCFDARERERCFFARKTVASLPIADSDLNFCRNHSSSTSFHDPSPPLFLLRWTPTNAVRSRRRRTSSSARETVAVLQEEDRSARLQRALRRRSGYHLALPTRPSNARPDESTTFARRRTASTTADSMTRPRRQIWR